MSIELLMFKNIDELFKYIDDEINRVRTLLSEYFRRLDELRIKVERIKKLEKSISSIAGGAIKSSEGKEIDLMGIKVVIDPSYEQEVNFIEEAAKSLQDRLTVLQKIRKAIEPLSTIEDADIEVLMMNGVPVRIHIRIR
ncbi:MAG: hypothetical protein ACXQTI_08605 [Candidatus Nezhaarchaeales archaeon]